MNTNTKMIKSCQMGGARFARAPQLTGLARFWYCFSSFWYCFCAFCYCFWSFWDPFGVTLGVCFTLGGLFVLPFWLSVAGPPWTYTFSLVICQSGFLSNQESEVVRNSAVCALAQSRFLKLFVTICNWLDAESRRQASETFDCMGPTSKCNGGFQQAYLFTLNSNLATTTQSKLIVVESR